VLLDHVRGGSISDLVSNKERPIRKPRETPQNLLKQPPSADGGVSPIRWGIWLNNERVALNISYI